MCIRDSNVESNGDNSSKTKEAQQQKCENPTPNTKIETIFGKVTHIVEGLNNDQVEEARAIMVEATR